MSQDNGLELKVGSFVLLALLALSFFILSISDLSFFEKGRHIQVVFNFASGLREAAPVRLAGVEVGLVRKLKVFADKADGGKTKVRVDVWIKDNIAVPVDSNITINQLGILGEKYLEIIPGLSTDFFKNDGVAVGHDPVPIEKITEKIDSLMTKLEVTVDNVNEGRGTLGKLFTDESIYDNLDDLTLDLKSNPWKLLYRPKPKP
jgi:phospholipid/cholesterol/gamma-HCH transport system substrate-binding protein